MSLPPTQLFIGIIVMCSVSNTNKRCADSNAISLHNKALYLTVELKGLIQLIKICVALYPLLCYAEMSFGCDTEAHKGHPACYLHIPTSSAVTDSRCNVPIYLQLAWLLADYCCYWQTACDCCCRMYFCYELDENRELYCVNYWNQDC